MIIEGEGWHPINHQWAPLDPGMEMQLRMSFPMPPRPAWALVPIEDYAVPRLHRITAGWVRFAEMMAQEIPAQIRVDAMPRMDRRKCRVLWDNPKDTMHMIQLWAMDDWLLDPEQTVSLVKATVETIAGGEAP